jgi:hypothetical protein
MADGPTAFKKIKTDGNQILLKKKDLRQTLKEKV